MEIGALEELDRLQAPNETLEPSKGWDKIASEKKGSER